MDRLFLIAGTLTIGFVTASFAGFDSDGVVDEGDDVVAASAPPSLGTVIDRLDRDGLTAVNELWPAIGLSTAVFDDLATDAAVTISRQSIDLSGDGQNESLIQIGDPSGERWQIAALSERDGAAIARGSIELFNQDGRQPEVRLESINGGGRWLVVRSVGSTGAGYERHLETWHRVGDGSFTEALEYPSRGSVDGHGLAFNRTFSGSFLNLTEADGDWIVEVEFVARYANGDAFSIDGLDELFTRRGKVHYRAAGESSRFALDEKSSDLNEAEIVGLFADDEQGFLQHNFAQLRDIASNGSAAQRDWLSHFLERVDDCSEKTVLLGMLSPAGEPNATVEGD